MLDLLQRGLETVYRLEPSPDVRDFMLGDADRERLGVERAPREQLLLVQRGPEELEIGLFVDPGTLENLERNDPRAGVGEHNFADLCLCVEGVSHFVCVSFRARADVPVSGLELELQAEVDKYVTCVLLADGRPTPGLCERLFARVRYSDELSSDELARYRTANDRAHQYARSLETRFVKENRIPDMLAELRRFYRLTLTDKLDHIAAA